MVVPYIDCENPEATFKAEVNWDKLESGESNTIIIYDAKGNEANKLNIKTGGSGLKYFIYNGFVYGIYAYDAPKFTELNKSKGHIFGDTLALSIMAYGISRCGFYFELTKRGGFTGVDDARVLCRITEKHHKIHDNHKIELEPALEEDRKRYTNATLYLSDLASMIDGRDEEIAVDLESTMKKGKV